MVRTAFLVAVLVCAARAQAQQPTATAPPDAATRPPGATTPGATPPASATPPAAPGTATVPPITPEQFDQSKSEYAAGAAAYERGDYEAALGHFRAAYANAPSPELWFNIGRCHEHLGRWAAAASAYENYLAGKPTVEDAVQIRERISDLKLRAAATALLTAPPRTAPASAPSPPHGLLVPALVLLGGAVALGAGGVGTYFSEWSDYTAQRNACQGQCAPATLDGLRSRVQTAEVAAGVLWSLAGAALVADVTLWIVDARRRHGGERRVAVAGGLVPAVRF